jgi:hypothetical protein
MVRAAGGAVGAVNQPKEPRIPAVITDAFAQFDGHAPPVEINFSPPASRDLTPCAPRPKSGPRRAGMVKRYHGSFPSFSYEFDSRYPLQAEIKVSSTVLPLRRQGLRWKVPLIGLVTNIHLQARHELTTLLRAPRV